MSVPGLSLEVHIKVQNLIQADKLSRNLLKLWELWCVQKQNAACISYELSNTSHCYQDRRLEIEGMGKDNAGRLRV